MPDLVHVGTDSSGRPIRMSQTFYAAWLQVCDVLGFTPVITQGGWMGDGAAGASGTTHDGDALDLRIWNLTRTQTELVVKVLRAHAIEAWVRDKHHGGFDDPHIHAIPGAWAHPSPSALRQWINGAAGRDGLRGNGPDYHPYPLATTPPEDWIDMATKQEVRTIVREEIAREFDKERARDKAERVRDKRRHQRVMALLKGTNADVAAIEAALAEEA